MAPTLAKYVDMDNIPKKYGGTLDWRFGDMPYLEPAIANSLRWTEQIEQKGHRTFPIGPIKWQYDQNGDLVATAVGSENGKPRNRVIAGLHPESGVATLALSPGRAETRKLSKAGSVQTATPGSKMSSDAADMNVGKDPQARSDSTSRTGTYTVPFQDGSTKVASPPPDTRQGTSSTRYAQQEDTHAAGTLANGTPEFRIDGQGERLGVMEPNTVGQAPKEHPMPQPEEPPQPGMIEQAKDMAGQAVEQAKGLPTTVMSAVGLGGAKKAETPAEEVRKDDPEIDNMDGKNVEEFLRAKTMSKPQA